MNTAMKKPSRNVAGMLPFWAASAPFIEVRTLTGWTLAKMSRITPNTSIPRISVATPILLRIASRRTPQALMIVVITRVPIAMKTNIDVKPPGAGESRKATSPVVPPAAAWIESITNATMTATALTVTTWAQK